MNLDLLSTFVSDVLLPSLALVISILSLVMSYRSNHSTISRERLEKAYYPLFTAIEPLLYHDVEYSDIESFLTLFDEIEKKHSLFLHPDLKQRIHSITNTTNLNYVDKYNFQSIWFDICDDISKEYDRLCRLAHIPLRTISYRLNSKQYKNKFQLVTFMLKINLPNLFFITIILGIVSPNALIISYLMVLMLIINYLNC